MYPDEGADQDSQSRDEERERDLLLRTELVVDQSGGVDADERDECAKVEEFGTLLISEKEGSGQGNRADDQNVVSRHMMTRMDSAKDSWGQRIVPSHAVHKPGGSKLGCDCRSHICDHEGCVEQLKQKRTAYARGYMHESRIHHGWRKWLGSRPSELRYIDLDH